MNPFPLLWLAWSVGCDSQPVPTVVFPDPLVGLMNDLDADGSGAVTPEELTDSLVTPAQFSSMDQDGDGQLETSELRVLLSVYEVLAPPGHKGSGPHQPKGGPRSKKRRR